LDVLLDEATSDLKDKMYDYDGDGDGDGQSSSSLLVVGEGDIPQYYYGSPNSLDETLEEAATHQNYKKARPQVSRALTVGVAAMGAVVGVTLTVFLTRRSRPTAELATSEAASAASSYDAAVISFV
jgi:hypothetical protein